MGASEVEQVVLKERKTMEHPAYRGFIRTEEMNRVVNAATSGGTKNISPPSTTP
jgi:hypothetical protein